MLLECGRPGRKPFRHKEYLSPVLSVRSETDVSQPSGFISYFHNDISLVTEGQQAWPEQRGPVMRPPPWEWLGVGKDMSSRDGRGHRGSDHRVWPAVSQSGSSWRQHIYGLFRSLFTEEPGRESDVDPLGAGRGMVRGSEPLGWTTLDKCRLMMVVPSVDDSAQCRDTSALKMTQRWRW